jgi:probable rRNA maturation factor
VPLDLSHDIFIEADVPPEITTVTLAALIAFGLTAEGATGRWRIELVLGDDALLQRLHRDFLGLDTPTDIMSFPEQDNGTDSERIAGGQIYISVDRAAEHAADYGLTLAAELRFLVLHGILHLCGWDDGTDAERTAMLDRQTDLLRQFDRSNG